MAFVNKPKILSISADLTVFPRRIVIRSQLASDHKRFDVYYYNTLADLIAGLLQVIRGTRRDFLRRLLAMDRSEMSGSSHRARSYFAGTRDEFARYNDCREFSDKCWFLKKIGKRDTVPMVRIICKAADISYEDTSALTF